MTDLKLDWVGGKAARYACERWHYSGVMPNSSNRIGVWEDGKFIGVILFGIGAGNSTRGEKYGLSRKGEVAELVRIALRDHVTPVSRMIRIAIKMVKNKNPKLRLLISFADSLAQGHHGGIYQAGNWIYAGDFTGDGGFVIHGKITHSKTVHTRGWKQSVEWLRKHIDPKCHKAKTRKHRYLYPLDNEMRQSIAHLAKPYPKRAKQAITDDQSAERQGSTDPRAPIKGVEDGKAA